MPSAGAPPLCNDLVLDAPPYFLKSDPGTAPAPEGGTIVDGTYFATGMTLYGQSLPDVSFGRDKFVISGSAWQEVSSPDDAPGGVNPDLHFTDSVATTGTSLTLSPTCPTGDDAQTVTYTAESGRLRLFILDHGAMFEGVFTRQ